MKQYAPLHHALAFAAGLLVCSSAHAAPSMPPIAVDQWWALGCGVLVLALASRLQR